ncbi:MAG: hypothetical protein QOF15_3458, partial [Mycobacterium sp.]|nr:hypothetical protein [Mycobacterium sp.]
SDAWRTAVKTARAIPRTVSVVLQIAAVVTVSKGTGRR